MPQLIDYLNNIINSEEFRSRNKKNPTDFTRDRALSFQSLIVFLMNMNNKSYQVELDRFYQTTTHQEVPERAVYKGNLSKARAKLNPFAFKELDDHMVRHFYDNFQYETWLGYTLLAIDGTTLRVPKTDAILMHFGAWHPTKSDKPCPKARASQMFDVLNKITIDAIISPKSEGEIGLAATHCLKLQPSDLLLLDRGYPAHWLFKLILSMDAQFCARISYKKWNVVKKFYNSGKNEKIVNLYPTYSSKQKCSEMGLDTDPVQVRLIRVELDTGETEILVTSLTDMKKYPYDLFMELYHLRWPIEEDYKAVKYRLQIENFSGKTVHSVYQDFHAKVLSKNLTAIIATTTKKEIAMKSERCKYIHKVNFAVAISHMKNTIVLLFKPFRLKPHEIIERIRRIFIQTTEAVRPNRKFPRRHRVKQQRFFAEYKTCA